MTANLDTLTKAQLNGLLVTPLTASKLKKLSHADLVAMFDAMSATNALDADLRDARKDHTPPTDQTEKKRKPRALEDRLLFPLRPDEIALPRIGTKKHVMLFLLDAGTTIDALTTATGWSRDAASSALYYDVKKTGLGVQRVDGVLHLIKPDNLILTKDRIELSTPA